MTAVWTDRGTGGISWSRHLGWFGWGLTCGRYIAMDWGNLRIRGHKILEGINSSLKTFFQTRLGQVILALAGPPDALTTRWAFYSTMRVTTRLVMRKPYLQYISA